MSDKVVGILRESDGFFLSERTAEEAADDLQNQWVCAVITIPEDFDEAVATKNAHLEVAINNVDLDFSDDIRRSVSEAVVEIDAPELASLGEAAMPEDGGRGRRRGTADGGGGSRRRHEPHAGAPRNEWIDRAGRWRRHDAARISASGSRTWPRATRT